MSEQLRPGPLVYGEKEVEQILKRAAGLQKTVAVNPASLTLSEIEVIALDAGIDPEKVRQAAREIEQRRTDGSVAARLLGAPIRVVLERTVPGEVAPEDHEALVVEIRRALGAAGLAQTSSVGRTLTHTVFGRSQLEITVTPASGSTHLRIEAAYGNLAGGLFGGIVGSVGGGVGPNVGWMLPAYLHTSPTVGVAAAATVIGATWLGCRFLFRKLAGDQQSKLRGLLDALERQLAQARARRT